MRTVRLLLPTPPPFVFFPPRTVEGRQTGGQAGDASRRARHVRCQVIVCVRLSAYRYARMCVPAPRLHCFPSLSVGGERDGGLDSRSVIKRLFRDFLNRISISPALRGGGDGDGGGKPRVCLSSVRKGDFAIEGNLAPAEYTVACRQGFSFPTRLREKRRKR